MSACAACLRLSHLVGYLAPRIAGLLGRPSQQAREVLTLPECELVDAVAGKRAGDAWRFLERFDSDAAGDTVRSRGMEALCRHSRSYPARLRELHDPPAVLYVTGARPLGELLKEPAAALVGTRRPSPYGLETAHALGRGLGVAGVTVVSGLALGIDAAGHRGALDGAGAALAVLAGGADVPYPRRNRRLYDRIRERGAVISEMPPGQAPLRWSFPARNRLMAGLADMTVVVEAAAPSGSLITAEFAQDLGRPVGAVPGRVTSRVAEGTNALLRDGARLVTAAEDVLEELFGAGHDKAVSPGLAPERPEGELGRVLEAVEGGGGIDAIAASTGMRAGAVRAALARLESSGRVIRVGLASYERAAMR